LAQLCWLCDKAHLHTHKRILDRQWQEGSLNNTLPGYSQAYHRDHQPIKGTLAQAQRSRRAQWWSGTQIKDSQRTKALSQPLPGLSQKSHQPHGPSVEPITVSHCEHLSGSPLGLKGVASNWGDWDPDDSFWTDWMSGHSCWRDPLVRM